MSVGDLLGSVEIHDVDTSVQVWCAQSLDLLVVSGFGKVLYWLLQANKLGQLIFSVVNT